MNMQDEANRCKKNFLEKAEKVISDSSKIPTIAIGRYCRMLTIYCDSEGKVTDDFQKTMEKCMNEIIEVEGMKEIFEECNRCPEE